MDAADHLDPRKVGDGPCDAEHPGVASGGQAQRFRCLMQQALAGCVGRGMAFEGGSIEFGIGSCPAVPVGVARGLAGPCRGDARGDGGRGFAGRRQGQVRCESQKSAGIMSFDRG